MIKSLAKFTVACALAVATAGASGCTMSAGDDEPIGQIENEYKSTYTLHGRATYDASLGEVVVDLATTQLAEIGDAPYSNPHTADRFLNVRVWLANGESRRLVTSLGGEQIGPGGGCIHFRIPANVGDTLQIDASVRLSGSGSPRAGRTAPFSVQVGDWVNDPTVNTH